MARQLDTIFSPLDAGLREKRMDWARFLFLVGPMGLGLIVAIGALWWTRKTRLAGRRSPLTRGLLRPAGHALKEQFDDTFVDIMAWLMVATMIPAYMGALNVGGGVRQSPGAGWLYLLVALGAIGLSAYKLIKLHTKAMNFRMGWDAETAAGQELDQLMRSGAAVFHDFQAGTFNIDHVLICAGGIYAVETKSRLKPKRGDKDGAKVTYDGKVLSFPGWTESEPIEQARRQATWLAAELSKAIGEQIHVSPVVALPGWFVSEQRRSDVRVMNPKNFRFLLENRDSPLPRSLVDRIAYQVEQRCRDIAPAYETAPKR